MDIAIETSGYRKHVSAMDPEHEHDEDSGRRRRFLPAWFDEDIIASTLLIFVGIVSLLAFVYGQNPVYDEFAGRGFGRGLDLAMETASRPGAEHFTAGASALGMTPEAVATMYPDMELRSGPNGRSFGTFTVGGTTYTVSFLGSEHGRKAYRTQYRRILADEAELDFVEEFADHFDAPPSRRCGRGGTGSGTPCRYHWNLDDGTSVEVLSRIERFDDGTAIADMTVTAVNVSSGR